MSVVCVRRKVHECKCMCHVSVIKVAGILTQQERERDSAGGRGRVAPSPFPLSFFPQFFHFIVSFIAFALLSFCFFVLLVFHFLITFYHSLFLLVYSFPFMSIIVYFFLFRIINFPPQINTNNLNLFHHINNKTL